MDADKSIFLRGNDSSISSPQIFLGDFAFINYILFLLITLNYINVNISNQLFNPMKNNMKYNQTLLCEKEKSRSKKCQPSSTAFLENKFHCFVNGGIIRPSAGKSQEVLQMQDQVVPTDRYSKELQESIREGELCFLLSLIYNLSHLIFQS